MHSKVELRQKLVNKGFCGEIITSVLLECESCYYLNDHEYARSFVLDKSRLRPMGSWRLKRELSEKGIAGDIIKEVLATHLPVEDELTLLAELFQKKWENNKGYREKPEKLVYFLMRRGFSKNHIFKVAENLGIDIWQYNQT